MGIREGREGLVEGSLGLGQGGTMGQGAEEEARQGREVKHYCVK